jgi:putative transposon-encoded protein
METDTKTNVYVIQACQGGPAKIGHSVDVDRRLTEIQPGHPFELQVARLFEGVDPAFESWLHTRFADYRLHGEWFDETVIELIDAKDLRGLFESGRSPWWGEEPGAMHIKKDGYNERTTVYATAARVVANGGNSGRVFVPKKWVGKHVKIVLMEPVGEEPTD